MSTSSYEQSPFLKWDVIDCCTSDRCIKRFDDDCVATVYFDFFSLRPHSNQNDSSPTQIRCACARANCLIKEERICATTKYENFVMVIMRIKHSTLTKMTVTEMIKNMCLLLWNATI